MSSSSPAPNDERFFRPTPPSFETDAASNENELPVAPWPSSVPDPASSSSAASTTSGTSAENQPLQRGGVSNDAANAGASTPGASAMPRHYSPHDGGRDGAAQSPSNGAPTLVRAPHVAGGEIAVNGGYGAGYPSYAGYATAAGKNSKTGLRATLDMLYRRRKPMLLVWLAAVGVAFLLSLSAQRVYQSMATVLINTAPIVGNDGKKGSANAISSDVDPLNSARKLETAMEIMRTPTVIRTAFDRLTPETQDSLADFYNVNISAVRNTDLLTVSVDSHSPEASAAFANAICTAYIDKSQQDNRREVGAAARYAGAQLTSVTDKLRQARNELRRFQEENQIGDVKAFENATSEEVNELRSALRQAQIERNAAQAQIAALQAEVARLPREISTSRTEQRPAIAALREQLTRLQIERITAMADYRPESQTVQRIDGQIARIESRLASEPQTETSDVQRSPNPVRAAVVQKLGETQTEARALAARVEGLARSLDTATQRIARLPGQTSEVSRLQSEVLALEENYQLLNKNYQTLRLSEEARLANATLVSKAQPPEAPTGGSRTRALLLAAIGGLVLAYALALLLERLDERVRGVDEAEEHGLPVLIDVPLLRDRSEQTLVRPSSMSGALAASFEMLRAQLALRDEDGMPVSAGSSKGAVRSVLVTSSLAGEGKSSCAINLAIASAQAGENVVLLDCDARQPSLHRVFQVANERGWSDVVAGRCSLQEALIETHIDGLWLLTSGTRTRGPVETLRSAAAAQVIQQLESISDLLVIDSPPALHIADASILAARADATLLVVSCADAARQEVARTLATLAGAGANLVGIVLTKVAPTLGSNNGYSSHYASRYLQNGTVWDESASHESTVRGATSQGETAPVVTVARSSSASRHSTGNGDGPHGEA